MNKNLEDLKIEAIKCQCYVIYWTAIATSKTNASRVVSRGGKQLSLLELEKSAFDTALNHIRRLDDIQEEIRKILV
jgi:hypothetical protein